MKRPYRGLLTVLVIVLIAFQVAFEPLGIEREKPPDNPLTVRYHFAGGLLGIPREAKPPPASSTEKVKPPSKEAKPEEPPAKTQPMTQAELEPEIEALVSGRGVTLNPDAKKKVEVAGNDVILSLILTPGKEREEADQYKEAIAKALQGKYGTRAGAVQLVAAPGSQQARNVLVRVGPVRIGSVTLLPTVLLRKPTPRVKLGLDLQGGVHLVLECVPVSTFAFVEPRPDLGASGSAEPAGAQETSQPQKASEAKPEPEAKTPPEATARDWSKLGDELRAYLVGRGVDIRSMTPVERGLTVTTRTADKEEADRHRGMIQAFLAQRVPTIQKDREENIFLGRGTDTIATVREVIQRRVDGFGLTEPVLQIQGDRRLMVELPGTAPEGVQDIIGKPADLRFMFFDPNKYDFQDVPAKPTEKAGEAAQQLEQVKVINKRTSQEIPHSVAIADPTTELILRGRDLKDNSQGLPSVQAAGWEVAFEFKPHAAGIFRTFTSQHIKKRLAIVLNDEIVSAPVIQSTIGAHGVITGNFTPQEAAALAVLLNAGALPIPLEIVENQRVSATLGKQSVDMSLRAGIIGIIFILIFMIAYYRLPGILANVALAIYGLLTLAVLIGLDATLTLTGIAGFLLSIGMAVDANVLIFERLKEELRSGKSLRVAADAAFARAWTAILDSNVTTILAGLALMIFIPGGVRGFATILIIGVLCSMFTAITCTRVMMQVLTYTRLARVRVLFLGHL